jgi:hypothetical protein
MERHDVKVRFLESDRVIRLHERISALGAAHGLSNIFNVGLLNDGAAVHCVFRALPIGGTKPFHSYYARLDGDADELVAEDLSLHARAHGVGVVADPKLFALDGRIYATFNTGQPDADAVNDVYIMEVSPWLGVPQLCRLDGRRKAVEKNWAFMGVDGGLIGLYELAPLTTLRQVGGKLGTEEELVFQTDGLNTASTPLGVTLSIGTQIVSHGGEHLFICHEKVGFRSRRAYIGRLCRVSLADGRFQGLEVSSVRLLNSIRHALPHRPVHNPSLISATYFAGLTISDDDLLLSYGINDVDFSVARVRKDLLWS